MSWTDLTVASFTPEATLTIEESFPPPPEGVRPKAWAGALGSTLRLKQASNPGVPQYGLTVPLLVVSIGVPTFAATTEIDVSGVGLPPVDIGASAHGDGGIVGLIKGAALFEAFWYLETPWGNAYDSRELIVQGHALDVGGTWRASQAVLLKLFNAGLPHLGARYQAPLPPDSARSMIPE